MNEMGQYTFTVPGPPRGKARHRSTLMPRKGTGIDVRGVKYYCKKDFFIKNYDPKDNTEYAGLVRDIWRRKYGTSNQMDGPVGGLITAFFAPPKSTSKVKLAKMLGPHGYVTKKPDFDNISKLICDALNGWAYSDDSHGADVRVVKLWGMEERVEVSLWTLPRWETST